MKNEKIFEAEWNNFGEMNFSFDEISSRSFCFYNDSIVKMSVCYIKSGHSEVRSMNLTVEEFVKFKSLIFKDDIIPYCENAIGICDGYEWNFIFYSEGERIECNHVNEYGIDKLIRIVEFLNKIADKFAFSEYGRESIANLFF